MNTELFQDFLLDFNKEMKNKQANVLLLLDNAYPHINAVNLSDISNVIVKFIHQNMASVLQPCDCRIIK